MKTPALPFDEVDFASCESYPEVEVLVDRVWIKATFYESDCCGDGWNRGYFALIDGRTIPKDTHTNMPFDVEWRYI